MSGLFAQIDVAMMSDVKMRRAGPMARMLYVQTVLWSKENATDGEVDRVFLPDVAIDIKTPAKHFAKLVDVGLMETTGNGWKIPRRVWVKWNPTSKDLEAARRKKVDAGRRGSHNRWHTRDNWDSECEACHDDGYVIGLPDEPGAIASAIAPARQSDSQTSDLIPQTSDNTIDSVIPSFQTGPVDNEEKRRIVIEQEANRRQRERTGPELRSADRWKASVAQSIEAEHGAEIDRIIREYPTAPYDIIASAAIHGEKHSLQHHTRNEGAA